jgi:5-dehydro-2-deoxygluconokinase
MIEVLTIGRVSVDLYAEQLGVGLSEVRSFRKSVGGTATNVAVAAARLGHRAAVATKVGADPFGDYVRWALEATFGVDTTYLGTDPTLPTPLAFAVMDPPEDPQLIFRREPSAPDMQLTTGDIDPAAMDDVPIFWVSASTVSAEPIRSTVRALLERRNRRAHTVLDLDWRPQFWDSPADGTREISALLDQVTLAIGNRAECEIAVGTADPERAADRLLGRGLAGAMVKMGGDGVLVATADGSRTRVKPYPVEVVCGLGAGDAFGGAVCHGLLAGLDLAACARYGNAAGAIVAGRLMCADDMPTLDEVEHLLEERAHAAH